jgi:hypothetical protein
MNEKRHQSRCKTNHIEKRLQWSLKIHVMKHIINVNDVMNGHITYRDGKRERDVENARKRGTN